ncbi:MAG: aminotransferase class III-fold pyridoxal phosphate-dependent enzyme [Myxococcales bacterium]|nr:aminotransferase class III-fold pyridoxal phosphate-dependent enzyme [Myxococcales bacterium]
MTLLRGLARLVDPTRRLRQRLLLSRAKHPGLAGHPRTALRIARLVPALAYDAVRFFASDDAPDDVAQRRRAGFDRLARQLRARAPRTLAVGAALHDVVSDAAFVAAHRVPFQYRDHVRAHLPVAGVLAESDGVRVRDLDGNWAFDLGGSYGVNLFGNEFYRRCIDRGVARARELGAVLGAYHPIVLDNARRLRAVSGLDEVSFHMSGTEAVMQAVRLARYHTGRARVVRFCGAYHGWWDGVQVGVGNPRPARDVLTLAELSPTTLEVLRTRDDIACVLVNPIQAMHPNQAPPVDSTLLTGERTAGLDRAAYARWLADLRAVCSERGIVLILDEVFLGFRLARGGAQEYFGVRADLVTYGKSLGGGLPVGVVCGRRDLMRRFRDERPADICFARGTFNAHPYVMATMHEFLVHLDDPAVLAGYAGLDALWDGRARRLNERLARLGLPLRVAGMPAIWTTVYTQPGRYHWMFQYYLRAAGLAPGWIGSGRFIFPNDLSDADFAAIADRFVAAAEAMEGDGWWWTAGMNGAAIKRRAARELLAAAVRRVASFAR